MTRVRYFLSKRVIAVTVFIAVVVLHFLWLSVFPDRDPVQDEWTTAPARADASWVRQYVDVQNYWMGISYGFAVAFAAFAFVQYRETRLCAARNAAIGGVTLSGVLSVLGCFLLGCCGSPMLGVYLSLFGTAFLQVAKPLAALITVLSVILGWWWMRRHLGSEASCPTCRTDTSTGEAQRQSHSLVART